MIDLSVTNTANELWGSNWHKIREFWQLSPSVFHFNHGAYGAVPVPVRKQQALLFQEIDSNPSGFYRRKLDTLLEDARLEAAEFCGASPESFAWVRNASEGMSVAIAAVPLEKGDEVVITNFIYPAVRLAVEQKCRATGATLVEVQLPITEDDTALIAEIAAAINRHTRLLIIDEIASATARVFPVREIASVARENDVILIVDGAHAPGMYELSVKTLGADLWVGNFHKWVSAPHGAAAIWAAPRLRKLLRPSSVGYRDALEYPGRFGRLGTDDLTSILCTPFAIRFLKEIGLDKIYSYNKQLAACGAGVITQALNTQKVQGHFAARHPIALPEGTAQDADSALALQTQIATILQAEVSVSPPIGGQKHGTVVISAYAYNHPREYEQFGELLANFIQKQNTGLSP